MLCCDISTLRDHPRACGEKGRCACRNACAPGSPPRVRGKDAKMQDKAAAEGITPARAGKRNSKFVILGHLWDHPRACGEKAAADTLHENRAGSPPRVRGKDSCRAGRAGKPGITPARAGKRSRSISETVASWDHPRACGEKKLVEFGQHFVEGSPPRVRGKDVQSDVDLHGAGITPARAGKSPKLPQKRTD